jgi:hypothetical protein
MMWAHCGGLCAHQVAVTCWQRRKLLGQRIPSQAMTRLSCDYCIKQQFNSRRKTCTGWACGCTTALCCPALCCAGLACYWIRGRPACPPGPTWQSGGR